MDTILKFGITKFSYYLGTKYLVDVLNLVYSVLNLDLNLVLNLVHVYTLEYLY